MALERAKAERGVKVDKGQNRNLQQGGMVAAEKAETPGIMDIWDEREEFVETVTWLKESYAARRVNFHCCDGI
jgi:hypothetical protein